jgi:hypothetical protein
MDNTTIIILAIITIPIAVYLVYKYFSPSDKPCVAKLVSIINNWGTTKDDFVTACTWLDEITLVNGLCPDNIPFTMTYTLSDGTSKTIEYTNTNGVFIPKTKPFPSCVEDYPKSGMTMTFNIDGTTVTKVWPALK